MLKRLDNFQEMVAYAKANRNDAAQGAYEEAERWLESNLPHHAGTIAGSACFDRAAVLGTTSITGFALDLALNLDFFGNAFGDFFEGKGNFDPQIAAAFSSGSPAGSSPPEKSATEGSAVGKHITKLGEDVFHSHTTATKTTTSRSYCGKNRITSFRTSYGWKNCTWTSSPRTT